jgi:UDP-N-acetylenolpyruvoylglucosamine reductase
MKLKGMVRNAKKAEAAITALKISYLKRIGKGSNVIVMDSSVPRTVISFPIASSSALS